MIRDTKKKMNMVHRSDAALTPVMRHPMPSWGGVLGVRGWNPGGTVLTAPAGTLPTRGVVPTITFVRRLGLGHGWIDAVEKVPMNSRTIYGQQDHLPYNRRKLPTESLSDSQNRNSTYYV